MWLSRAPRLPGRCRPFLGRALLGRAVRAPSIPTASSVRVRLFTEKPTTESSPGFSKVRQADVSRENVDEVGSEVKEMKMKIGALENKIGALENKIGADEDELRDKVKALEEAPEEKKAALRESMKEIKEALTRHEKALTRLREDRDKAEAKLERMIASGRSVANALPPGVIRITPTLLAPDRLLERRERVSPPHFIGEEHLPAIVDRILQTLPDDSDRKPPFAVIRATRSGKTRLQQEIANRLREKGIIAIPISFNGSETAFNDQVEDDAEIALLRRLSFALSSQKLDWMDCGVGDLEGLFACQSPVVLIVDEINAVFRPKDMPELKGAKKLWRWLKMHFLIANRQLIFSSHANDTYEQVSRDFVATDSCRPVEVLSPPLIADPVAALELFPPTIRVTTDSIALMGRIPGHVIGRAVVDTKLMEVAEHKMDREAFARACLNAQLTDHNQWNLLPRPLRQLGLFEVADARFLRWTPYCIAALLEHKLLRDLSHSLASTEHRSGKIWEFMVALAVVLHRLARKPHPYLARAGDNSPVSEVVSVPQTVATWDALVKWVAAQPGHLLILPSLANFPGTDLVESVDGEIVGEYQLKTRVGKPSCKAHLKGAAWLMVGDPPSRTRVRGDGWIKATDAEMKTFLGDSLFRAVPELWLQPITAVAKRPQQ